MKPIFIYRITHINNLDFILKNGVITCPNHANRNPEYKGIGNNQIINLRNARPIPVKVEHTFRDYIAFYFGKRSIMLYNIRTGYGEVERIPQHNIIYFVYDLSKILKHGYDFFFTDGHALQIPVTQFFSDLKDLKYVNFRDANAKDFSAAAEIHNPGLKRRKQAEFDIYRELQLNHLHEIVVFSKTQRDVVNSLLNTHGWEINVGIDKSCYF